MHWVTLAVTAVWIGGVVVLKANPGLSAFAAASLLVLLGFVATADLLAGFVGGLSENGGLVYLASVIAGAIGGPIYWLWLGRLLRRDA